MNTQASFQNMLERSKKRDKFWVETAILEFTEEMAARMDQLKVTNSQLAERLNVNPAFVTKLLRGKNNFTIETMVKLSRALDAELRVHMQPAGTVSQWINFLKEKPAPQPAQQSAWDSRAFTKILAFPSSPNPYEPVRATA